MSYAIEEVNGCTKKIKFNFEKLDLTAQIKSALAKKQKNSSIKGFRPGKAPIDMIEKLFKPQIEMDALDQFINDNFYNAIEEEKLRIVGRPEIGNLKYEPAQSVSFDAVVEIYPEFELNSMKGYSFNRASEEINESDIENVKKSYLESKAEVVEVESGTALKVGHSAVMNFEGIKENGERPENMKGTEHLLEIGSKQFIPGFEEGMVGMKKGEKKTIDLVFPADYMAEELRNAKVTFEVELLEIKEKRYPEFTDELAKEYKYDSVEDFMNKTRESLIKQKKQEVQAKLHQDILNRLVEDNAFDVPKAMINQQVEHLIGETKNNFKMRGMPSEYLDMYLEKWQDEMSKRAIFQIRSGLILDKLAKKYNIETTDTDFEEKIAETVQTSGVDYDRIKEYYSSNKEMRQNIMYAIREEKTFKKIIEEVTVK